MAREAQCATAPMLAVSLLVACGEPTSVGDAKTGDGGAADGNADIDGGGSGAADGGVKLISDVLGYDCGGTPSRAPAGVDMKRFVFSDSDARCNDGTPAVMFVRRGSGQDLNRWVMFLEGGGQCGIAPDEDCRDRWCRAPGDRRADKTAMSSRYEPPGITGTGIFLQSAANPLASFTQVFLAYCSSDVWTGQNDFAVQHPSGAGTPYALRFDGHRILERALQHLSAGVTSQDGTQKLPSIGAATEVIFAGSSAGSAGAQQNADWLRGQLEPGVVFHAVFDAVVQIPWDAFPEAGFSAAAQAFDERSHRWLDSDAGWHPFRDVSCVAAHGSDSWQCDDLGHVLANHVTVPFFARSDLADPLQLGNLPFGMDASTYMSLERATLLRLHRMPSLAEEAPPVIPAVFGPRCGQHTVLLSAAAAAQQSVEDATGVPWTMTKATSSWIAGGGFGAAVEDLSAPTSTCP